jgi:hypothetical protein
MAVSRALGEPICQRAKGRSCREFPLLGVARVELYAAACRDRPSVMA